MSEPEIKDVAVELDLHEIEQKVRIDLQTIQESLKRIEDYLNDYGGRIYDLENP